MENNPCLNFPDSVVTFRGTTYFLDTQPAPLTPTPVTTCVVRLALARPDQPVTATCHNCAATKTVTARRPS